MEYVSARKDTNYKILFVKNVINTNKIVQHSALYIQKNKNKNKYARNQNLYKINKQ